jgi:hypothetical protein
MKKNRNARSSPVGSQPMSQPHHTCHSSRNYSAYAWTHEMTHDMLTKTNDLDGALKKEKKEKE